ncbi:hypothetical protein R4419_09195 [Mycolicibacterium fortuitum]|uniref:Uncharacterized protein n=1 Tax=Mycolicibacterium fortuitum TaxID=1766 RepID=A0AAE4VAF4_MYCFO|nr:hypothetical protein [Mycolicibacterium fortuitum]MDG5770871.1 hypothetical protein [Mycolicibacterium fortuitum]MDG5782458.1 hypothetical protein [Mycolicibacterium fortuitum]MDV7191717.1 hypothetical protein [Mycolicibacterium fortuitum]MDV7204332.1 hypothetical protein [Mycolicibacterium fortuitum]MDV7225853.1 hypothetical protein [Mycolicibacterium fortuitum]
MDDALHTLHYLLRHLRQPLHDALDRLRDSLHHLACHLRELAHHLPAGLHPTVLAADSAAAGGATCGIRRARAPPTRHPVSLCLQLLGGIQIAALIRPRRLTESFSQLLGYGLRSTDCRTARFRCPCEIGWESDRSVTIEYL